MDYNQINNPSSVGNGPKSHLTIDKACKLLNSAQPMVWAVSVVFGLLGVTLIVRYLWAKRATSRDTKTDDNGTRIGELWSRS